MTVILEGAWDCSHCGKKRISGNLTRCPECGDPCDAAFNPEEGYYLPDDAAEITDPEKITKALAGPNWTCGNCGEMNEATATSCSNCNEAKGNNDREVPVTDYVEGEAARGLTLSSRGDLRNDWVDATLRGESPEQVLASEPIKESRRSLPMSELPVSAPDSPYPDIDRPKSVKGSGLSSGIRSLVSIINLRLVAIIAVVAVVATIVIGGGVWVYEKYFATHTVDLTVKSMSWERSVEVEDFRTLTQSDWSVPSDGRVISSHSEVRSYVQVLDHYETKYRTVTDRVPNGSHNESYACGSTRTNLGNGKYSSTTKYCNRSVQDYKTVSHQESYQDPVYRNQPVYDTKYTYQVDRWVFDHWVPASGTENPYWPTPSLRSSNERVGDDRQEHYTVVVESATTEGGESRQFTEDAPNQATWERVQVGMVLKGEQTNAGNLTSVNWP